VIVALFTTGAGAAVFTLAMYSGSVFGTSSVGNWAEAEVTELTDAAAKARHARVWRLFMAHSYQSATDRLILLLFVWRGGRNRSVGPQ